MEITGLRTLCCALSPAEYQTSIQEKLPLIIGSSAAGLVFLIAVVVIAIVCNRWVGGCPPAPSRLAVQEGRSSMQPFPSSVCEQRRHSHHYPGQGEARGGLDTLKQPPTA